MATTINKRETAMKSSRGVMRMLAVGAVLGCMLTTSGARAQGLPGTGTKPLIDGCSQHADCDEGNPCTQNLCVAGLCVPALPVLGCCYNGECTPLGGEGGAGPEPVAPIIEVPPSGCATDDECEDGHPCTQNLCVVGECAALPVLGCCLNGDCANDSGGAPSDEPVTGGTNSSGGTSASGGSNTPKGMGGSTAAAANDDTDHSAGGDPSDTNHDAWAMEGGGCEMRAPTSHQAGFGALGLGLAALLWVERRRERRSR
jgi:hypothetical protein